MFWNYVLMGVLKINNEMLLSFNRKSKAIKSNTNQKCFYL